MSADAPEGFDEPRRKPDGNGTPTASASASGHSAANADGSGTCLQCGKSGEARQFCSSCGSPLWDVCFNCGESVRASQKFCGVCGVDLVAGVHDRSEQFADNLIEAQRLELDGRFDEATAILEPICQAEHGRLTSLARRAKELAAAIKRSQQRAQARADAAWNEAQTRFAAFEYDAVVKVLESVPQGLRTGAIADTFETARQRVEEIGMLERDLREVAAGGKGSDLLTKINRLLELRPDHALALKTAERYAAAAFKAAASRMAKHQYDEAVELLQRVPEVAVNDALTQLRQQAEEAAYLSWDFRNAPVADQNLLTVAARLKKLAPHDPIVESLWGKVQVRVEKSRQPSCLAPPTWAKPPERTLLGRPIDWAAGFRRIAVGPQADVAVLKQYPGSFFVACGLALEGLGEAHLSFNLRPDDKDGLLQRARRMVRKHSAASAWGIDLSSGGLKAVKLVRHRNPERVEIERCDVVEHRKIFGQAASPIEEHALVSETLRTFLSRNELKADRICVGLPGMMTFCRNVCLPPLDAKRIAEVMQYEVRTHMPIEVGNLAWGYQTVDASTNGEAVPHASNVMLVAVRQEQLRRHLEKLQDLKTDFDVVASDCIALHNFFHYERFGGEEGDDSAKDSAIGVLDVGTEGTNFVVSSRHRAWFRNIRVGGHAVSKTLARQLNVTFAQADQIKRDPAKTPRLGPVQEAVEPMFKDLVNEILASLQAYREAGGKTRVERFLGVGGAFQTQGLFRFLRTGR